jgi:hypothetical protein
MRFASTFRVSGHRRHSRVVSFFIVVILAALGPGLNPDEAMGTGGSGGYSLRFHGNGYTAPDQDRVKIPIDDPTNSNPGPPADVGATDFTIEFWMKAHPGDNTASPQTCGANVNWIYGNIVVDRDRFNQDRKFGISIAGGKVIFGVSGDGTGDMTICGTSDVLDTTWHHIAVARRRSDGWMWLFVDGALEAQADGPDGDVSYPDDGVPGSFCGGPCTNSDPFLVIGAEKHDAGPAYPSYNGWFDEMRISNVLRYTTPFTRPTAPFDTDASTAALYHFDEGTGSTINDSSGAPGGPSNGFKNYGGDPAGPEWSSVTPFSSTTCYLRPSSPASTQFFAEGATKDYFDTWILLTNPATETAEACLTFLKSGSASPGPKISIPPGSRRSVKIDDYLNTFEVATIVEGIGHKVYAERAMYSSKPGMEGAHLSKGSNLAASDWYMGEGASAGGFETWVLIANPDPSLSASVTVEFLTDAGRTTLQPIVLGPMRRKSIRVNDYVSTFDVSTHVHATGAGIVAERATYSSQMGRKGATASPAVPGTSTTHFLAEGATTDPFETWILVANPNPSGDATVVVDFIDETGIAASVVRNIPPGFRSTVRADDYLDSFNVSTRVTSTGVPVIAERAMYKDTGPGGLGAASGEPSGDPSGAWLAVEGATDGGFETWILVTNPDPSVPAVIQMTYLTGSGTVSMPQEVIPPQSRKSFKVNSAVQTFDVSSMVEVKSGALVVVDKAVYTPGYLTGDSTAGPAVPLA